MTEEEKQLVNEILARKERAARSLITETIIELCRLLDYKDPQDYWNSCLKREAAYWLTPETPGDRNGC